MNTESIIKVDGLRKSYGDIRAVDGISFEVRKGEIFGLVGPNGAGKTTTIECLEGLRKPDGGTVRVLGLDPGRDIAIRERIGVQLQSSALHARIKVREAMAMYGAFYPKSVDPEPLLQRLGIAEKKNAAFAKLSGGQKQRLSIAIAMIHDPEIVFFDELTTGLDPQARHSMWDFIRDIRDGGKTVVLTTHFMEEAERLCDRVAVLDHGRILALDTPADLRRSLAAEHRVAFTPSSPLDPAAVLALPHVTRVERQGEQWVVYGTSDDVVVAVVTHLCANRIKFRELRTEQANLEDVFLALTGQEMRD